MRPIFITGIGTGVGKTLVGGDRRRGSGRARITGNPYRRVTRGGGRTAKWIARMFGAGEKDPAGRERVVYPELYRLALAASPHIAAREEGVQIDLDRILANMPGSRPLIVEGAGGLLVPLNQTEFVVDLVKKLDAEVILVSRNYLGSINHSLLTAAVCKAGGLRVAGWIFNDQYLDYEREIVDWTGIPAIASIPDAGAGAGVGADVSAADAGFVRTQARRIRPMLEKLPIFAPA